MEDIGESIDHWISLRFDNWNEENATERRDPPLIRRMRDDDSRGSRVTLCPVVEVSESGGVSLGLKVKAKLDLPESSHRVRLIIDSDYDETDLTPELSRSQDVGLRGGDQRAASIEVDVVDLWKFRTSADFGLKFKPEPQPRIGVRGRLTRKLDPLRLRFTQRFFWEGGDGFGERSTIDLEHQKPDTYLRRLSASVLWSEASEGVRVGYTFQNYWYLSRSRAIGINLGAFGPLEPHAFIETYSARISFKRRLLRDWLFMELEPGIDWDREEGYQAEYFFRIKFDIIFGDWVELTNGNGKH